MTVLNDDLVLLLGGPSILELEALTCAFARREGVRVAGVGLDEADVLRKVESQRPHTVMLCVDGPEWGGIRTCLALKQSGSESRVVLAGAANDGATLMAAVKAGADGYVTVADGVDAVLGTLRRVERGESSVPPGMLGALLRGLIEFRREDDRVVERFASLGKREREVLAEVVAGLDHHAIAAKLHLSPHTARTHTQNVLAKLGVHSRLEAARLVFEHDLLARFGVDAEARQERP